MVKVVMAEHAMGVDGVRGATYLKVVFEHYEKKALERELRGIRGECLLCGNSGHYISDCPDQGAQREEDDSGVPVVGVDNTSDCPDQGAQEEECARGGAVVGVDSTS